MIELKNISKTYSNKYVETKVLEGIDCVIKDKSIVAITGSSGSGKSTLLNIMCGLDMPSDGEVLHDEVDITKLKKGKLAKFRLDNCGFVFQDFSLVSTLTVKENIMIAALGKYGKVDNDWYEEVLDMLSLKEREAHFPHQLSGGEKQRVAIARAIITRPKVIFADEPTGNLDNENTTRIMDYLVKYAREKECIFIYVTHELELCPLADVIISISDRKISVKQGEGK